METPTEIKHHKEIHSLYIFVAIVVFGILVLQPISMVFLLVAQTFIQ